MNHRANAKTSLKSSSSLDRLDRLARSRFEREATGWQLLPAADYANSGSRMGDTTSLGVSSIEDGAEPGPCTITIRRRVEKEKTTVFREWQRGITEQNFKFEGFLGATLLQEVRGSRVLLRETERLQTHHC